MKAECHEKFEKYLRIDPSRLRCARKYMYSLILLYKNTSAKYMIYRLAYMKEENGEEKEKKEEKAVV